MIAQLMLTCLCDAFYGEVGIATVRVLEHCGVKVVFPEEQTCCGQPPFNVGDWSTAREIASRCEKYFDAEIPIVVPSASCAAMMRHGYSLMANNLQQSPATSSNPQPRIFELSEFLLDIIGVDHWPLRGNSIGVKRRIAFHQSCHGRMIDLGDRQRRLLSLVPGLNLVPFDQQEQCCGFGGAFSATHPTISEGIGLAKLQRLIDSGVSTIASGDMGCLMHLQGLAERHEFELQFKHYVQILAEAIA